jgi:putative transposase
MKKRFTEEQIIGLLREAQRPGSAIRSVCRKNKITEQTFHRWRNKYGGMDVSEPARFRSLRKRTPNSRGLSPSGSWPSMHPRSSHAGSPSAQPVACSACPSG